MGEPGVEGEGGLEQAPRDDILGLGGGEAVFAVAGRGGDEERAAEVPRIAPAVGAIIGHGRERTLRVLPGRPGGAVVETPECGGEWPTGHDRERRLGICVLPSHPCPRGRTLRRSALGGPSPRSFQAERSSSGLRSGAFGVTPRSPGGRFGGDPSRAVDGPQGMGTRKGLRGDGRGRHAQSSVMDW